jgi:uncharacterized surface protein with fasciclin (FAS1) repeats
LDKEKKILNLCLTSDFKISNIKIAQTAHDGKAKYKNEPGRESMLKKLVAICTAVLVLFSAISVSANPNNSTNKDLVETAVEAGQFTILTKALEAAGLTNILKEKGKFTIFAPTDEAFGKLPSGTLENLLKPENKEKLKSILLYHVVKTNLSAKRIGKLDGRQLVTAQGSLLKVNSQNGVKINDSNVVKADVKAVNGVIHVIDTVLIPTN